MYRDAWQMRRPGERVRVTQRSGRFQFEEPKKLNRGHKGRSPFSYTTTHSDKAGNKTKKIDVYARNASKRRHKAWSGKKTLDRTHVNCGIRVGRCLRTDNELRVKVLFPYTHRQDPPVSTGISTMGIFLLMIAKHPRSSSSFFYGWTFQDTSSR